MSWRQTTDELTPSRQGGKLVIASNTTIWSIGLLLSSLPLFQGFDMKTFDFETPMIVAKV